MRTVKAGVLTFVLAALMPAAGLIGTSSAAAAGRTLHGCPYGAFCIYPRSYSRPHRLPKGRPEKHGIFYTYGYHNLSRQYGWHYIFNNQYGGAGASFCYGFDGTGGQDDGYRGRGWGLFYLTPVNSITLWLYNYSFGPEISCHM